MQIHSLFYLFNSSRISFGAIICCCCCFIVFLRTVTFFYSPVAVSQLATRCRRRDSQWADDGSTAAGREEKVQAVIMETESSFIDCGATGCVFLSLTDPKLCNWTALMSNVWLWRMIWAPPSAVTWLQSGLFHKVNQDKYDSNNDEYKKKYVFNKAVFFQTINTTEL